MADLKKGQHGYNSNGPVHSVSSVRLVSLSLMVMTPYFMNGMMVAFTSIALSQIRLGLDEKSWFGSIISITCPFGELFVGLIIDKFGRRISMLSSVLPCMVGWFLMAYANNSLTRLYAGRALHGFAQGAGQLPPLIYAAECITVNNNQIRSSVGTSSCASTVLGGLLTYACSLFWPYDKVALVSGLLCSLWLLLIAVFIPESPAWLYRKGRVGDAEIAQQRLGIKQPILRMLNGCPKTTVYCEPDSFSLKDVVHYVGHIRRREVYKPLIISITFFAFYEFSGLYCIMMYLVDVICIPSWTVDPYVLSIVAQAFQLVGNLLLTSLLPYSGVKVLCSISFLGVSLGFFVLALCVLLESSASSEIFNYLHVISVCVVLVSSQLGAFPLPYALLGEIFPMGAKGYASLSLISDSAFGFIALKLFPYAFAQSQVAIFLVFSSVSLCAVLFVISCVPETVGKTMDEIEEGFKKPNGVSVMRSKSMP